MKCISYKEGYNYQLSEIYTVATDIMPPKAIDTEYIKLNMEGILIISEGYAWDGPSGPTIDTLTFMRGSLVHDAFYQMMRAELLDSDVYRKQADDLLQKICKEDGMWFVRAWVVHMAVRIFGGSSADAANENPVIRAPEDCQA